MKTKTDATKVLIEAGWTYEEIESVLSTWTTTTVYPNYDWKVREPLTTPSYPTQPEYPNVTTCNSNCVCQ